MTAFFRGKLETCRKSPVCSAIADYVTGYDVIRGPVADDCLFVVLDRFLQGEITDAALLRVLKERNAAQQYAAVPERDCSQISIVDQKPVGAAERRVLKRAAVEKRRDGIACMEKTVREYRRTGRYFDEIVENWNESEPGSKAAL